MTCRPFHGLQIDIHPLSRHPAEAGCYGCFGFGQFLNLTAGQFHDLLDGVNFIQQTSAAVRQRNNRAMRRENPQPLTIPQLPSGSETTLAPGFSRVSRAA